MARLRRSPRTLLLLSALTLLGGACERVHDRDLIGPLDRVHGEGGDGDGVGQGDARAYVAPVDLDLDWGLANALVPAADGGELVARIRVVAPDQLDLPRPPARVVLVVDTSASMKGDAIDGAKRAAVELVDSLADGDSFSLVVFHSRAEVLMPATIIGEESRAAARAEIERMQAWGTTDLAGGLRFALDQFAATPIDMAPGDPGEGMSTVGAGVWAQAGGDPQVLRRVVLLGDGVPNDPSSIPGLAGQLAANGVEVTALGYGLEYDEVLLASLAEQTHGHFRFVEQPDEVAALFRDEVLHIQRTVASDLQLAMGLGPGVRLIEVVGHPAHVDGGGRQVVSLGSITEGQSQELIVRLAVGPHTDGATVELSDLELAFTDVYTGTGARFERAFLSATASSDGEAIAASRDLDIARAGARARTNAATLDVLSLARNGQLGQAKSLLADAVKWAKREAEALSDPELDAKAKDLAALAPELEALARPRPQQAVESHVDTRPQAFPAQPSPEASRAIKATHSAAYNDLH